MLKFETLPYRIQKFILITPNGCWEWQGFRWKNGYGSSTYRCKTIAAHRLTYLLLKGELPVKPLVLDHTCRNSCCVNPDHLEAVTQYENSRRGESFLNAGRFQAAKTHCPYGHPYDAANTYFSQGRRFCRICRSSLQQAYVLKKRKEKSIRAS